jgi:hypothetical protein
MIFDKVDKVEVEDKIKSAYPQVDFSFANIMMNDSRKESALARHIVSNFY